jgi:NADH-quinone oxidoreductase subunit E
LLSDTEREELERELEQVPYPRAACIEGLKIVQRHRGWVSDEALRDLAEALAMSPDELDSVATFYNLIFRRPVGRHVILVCDSVSCWTLGYEDILAALEQRLGVGFGRTTEDGRFTLLPIPCLGCCDHAPALMIDEDLHQDLRPEGLDAILARYE